MEELTPISQASYGEKYHDHYFEQYKLYLAGIEKISDRRENANKYFVTLNSGIMVAISFLLQHDNISYFVSAMIGLLVFGMAVSAIFFVLINSYKQLNSGKFKILHKIEEGLPIRLYTEEWQVLGRGKDAKKYFPFSHIERVVPIVFCLIYVIVLANFIAQRIDVRVSFLGTSRDVQSGQVEADYLRHYLEAPSGADFSSGSLKVEIK